MTGRSDAPVVGVTMQRGRHDLEVSVSDGLRRGVVSWDPLRCTYRADIDIVAPSHDLEPQTAHTVDAVWEWLATPQPGVLPGRVVVGQHPVELLTVDSLVNRLATLGFRPDRVSLSALFDLRSAVRDRCGSVVFLGRHRPGASGSLPYPTGEIVLGLPDGGCLPLRPLIDHPEHGFGWGRRGTAAVRTATVLVDLAWSPGRDAATEAAVIDLAFTVLAEIRGGFVWRVESVADWIATEAGELSDEVGRAATGTEPNTPTGFRQLALELR